MILREDTNKQRTCIIPFFLFAFILFLFSGCTAKTEQIEFNSYEHENAENELSTVLGQWYVAEYLGESVEYHGIRLKTEEQENEEERLILDTKEIYLEKTIEIETEKVIFFSSPTEIGYYYSDWDEMFMIYRQPPDIWDETSPPFLCISILHEDFNENLDLILDNNNNATLYANGLFFRLLREI